MKLREKIKTIAFKEDCVINKDGTIMKDLGIFGRALTDIVLIDDTFSS